MEGARSTMIDNDLMVHQMQTFQATLDDIANNYNILVSKRYSNNLNRDQYMVYDMMDMLLSLDAMLKEINRPSIDPGYMLEKLTTMGRYIDTTKKHFEE